MNNRDLPPDLGQDAELATAETPGGRNAETECGEEESPSAARRPSSLLGLAVCLLIGLTLAGFAVVAMGAWETQQPLLVAAFLVLLPISVAVIVRALRSVL